MKQMYHPDDLAAMDPLVLMKNLDHVRMTSRRLSYILQQQVHLYAPEANQLREQIDTLCRGGAPDRRRDGPAPDPRLADRPSARPRPEPQPEVRGPSLSPRSEA